MTAIPAQLAHRPVQGGRVVPWIALKLPDGTYDFAGCEGRKANRSMLHGICQVCGKKINGSIVFFVADDQLGDLTVDVPPCCAPCAVYSMAACPMLAGHLTHYRTSASRASATDGCTKPGCDCGGWVKTETDRIGGTPAPTWYAVWCREYDRVARTREIAEAVQADRPTPGERLTAKITDPLKIRPIEAPR